MKLSVKFSAVVAPVKININTLMNDELNNMLFIFIVFRFIYDGESVNRTQLDIKRKIRVIRTWKNRLFLDISSTNIDTLVLSLYQCVETRRIEVFWLFSQPLQYLRFNLFVISETSASKVAISRHSCELLYATNTSFRKEETFLCEYPLHSVLLSTKNAQHNAALR
jgi:hypothetical protein